MTYMIHQPATLPAHEKASSTVFCVFPRGMRARLLFGVVVPGVLGGDSMSPILSSEVEELLLGNTVKWAVLLTLLFMASCRLDTLWGCLL